MNPDQEARNMQQRLQPQTGDWWHERFSLVCVVMEVMTKAVRRLWVIASQLSQEAA